MAREYVHAYWEYLVQTATSPATSPQYVSALMETFCGDLPFVRRLQKSRTGNWILHGRDGSRCAQSSSWPFRTRMR